MTTTDDLDKWNPDKLLSVIGAAESAHKSMEKLGEGLDGVKSSLADWGGQTAEAWKTQHGKVRTDITDQGWQAAQVVRALRPLYNEVRAVKSEYEEIKGIVQRNQWAMAIDGTITAPNSPKGEDYQNTMNRQMLEARAKGVLKKAEGVDLDIAAALRAITTGGVPTTGNTPTQQPAPKPQEEPKPEPRTPDPTIAAGALTPGDQLPLAPKDGQMASPTEATARHDGPKSGSDYLKPNAHPSPLLAGVSADEWRKRLSNFKPGDPLPDPRTPTGDKAIDAIGHAASQQNSTYAWGGNKSLTGPSIGEGDNGGGADQYNDPARRGYDCGGLVRYSLSESLLQNSPPNAPHDGFVRSDGLNAGAGTDRLDKSSLLTPVTDGGGKIPSSAIRGVGQPGDILVFQDMERAHQAFDGKNTQHTGIYIGNGFMINAPESGSPVRVDSAKDDGRNIDVLRIGP